MNSFDEPRSSTGFVPRGRPPRWFLAELALYNTGSWWRRDDGIPLQLIGSPRRVSFSRYPHYRARVVTSFWKKGESPGSESYIDVDARFLYAQCKRIEAPEGTKHECFRWEEIP